MAWQRETDQKNAHKRLSPGNSSVFHFLTLVFGSFTLSSFLLGGRDFLFQELAQRVGSGTSRGMYLLLSVTEGFTASVLGKHSTDVVDAQLSPMRDAASRAHRSLERVFPAK